MFTSSNGSKSFSLANIIEEQLNNITLGGNPLNLVEPESGLGLEDTLAPVEEAGSSRRNSIPGSGSSASRDDGSPPVDKAVEPLQQNEIRWFYKEAGSKTWRPFNGHDTISIESVFRTLPKEVQESKGKHGQPNARPAEPAVSSALDNKPTGARTPTNPKVLVLGGLYEVDLVDRTCLSIYWPGEEFIITRGSWFYESWQPLDEESSRNVEEIYLELFLGKKNSDYLVDSTTNAIRTEVFSDCNIDWYSPTEVYLYKKAASTKIVRSFTQKLGYFKKSTGSKIIRGYKNLAKDDDKHKDITHLVFVVHGIGQKMNIGAQIFSNTISIRERVSYLQDKYFPECNERVEFFPVEWRSNLVLDGGTVDAITPLHIKYLRQVLNSSAMDIMYYTSPLYCGEIQLGLVTEMNRLYSMFLERNPHMKPKVSVIAHSLGAVIVYDIVTGWMPMGTQNRSDIEPGKSRLRFPLDNFFCLGSPLAVFLALRVPKGHHGYHLFPPTLCNRLYNIYHLTDPVAYRLEPLVVKDYSRIAPLPLHSYNAINPIPYSEMNLELEEPADINAVSVFPPDGTSSPVETPNKDKSWRFWNLVRGKQCAETGGSPHHMDSQSQARDDEGNSSTTRLPGGLQHRLDYVLTSGTVVPLVFRSVLISHTAYWNNNDVAYFVLTRIFPELEIQRAFSDKSEPKKLTRILPQFFAKHI
ncbi:phospholipase DDHD1-like isoform X2 [Cimex lectularius]|uniref:DDHD domain-containing protein n=1 Tax=Cimex lectularius TaxID=79782 RepID=A0A8I6RE26_CIMLE|nr:phospholipase DDHD1-like isoform X2 [Cimex lectularius]XP_014242107.1 phospholipase DDHD1-like isoform X2 [Cimex lectularius]XP_014242108.1 phospholipase DDHD1-like isoform X2 [Cimex lectularius]